MSHMRKMPRRQKLPTKAVVEKSKEPILQQKVGSFEQIRRELSNDVLNVLDANNVYTWAGTRTFLENHTIAMFSNTLPAEERKTFGVLIELRRKYILPTYDPSQFLDSSNRIPLHLLMDCAQRYGSASQLADSVMNPHTPVGDTYIAFVLGLISKEQLEKLPVRFSKGALKKIPKKRSSKKRPS